MENKELETTVVENLTTPADPNIATTDENLTIDTMFQQSALPSLAKQIFSSIPVHGPTGAIFNLRKKVGTNDIELVRGDVTVISPSVSIPTGITQEAIDDMRSIFGKEANNIIGKLLRGIANDDENEKTIAFLEANSAVAADLTLSNSLNAEVNLFEITQKVHELVLKINSRNTRSYESWAVIPFTPLGGIMGLSQYAGAADKDERGLFIAKIGQTKFYMNPDSTITLGTEATGVATVVGSTNVTAVSATTGIFENATLTITDNGTNITSVTSSLDTLDTNGVFVAAAGDNLLPAPVALGATALTLTGGATITLTSAATGAGGAATFDTTGAVAWSSTPSTMAYVGIKDTENPSKSSAVFSPYETQISPVTDPQSGNVNFHIFNRYAITPSPLSVLNNEMLYKFNIL